MRNFRNFLTEEYHNLLLLEAKVDEFTNRWLKIHAEHPVVKQDPEKAKKLIKHSFGLGQSQDEHMYITTQYLNNILKPEEDDPTVRDTLGMWRKMVQRNLHGGKKISDYDHDSITRLFAGFPELRKSQKKAGSIKEIEKYHIGQIDHPDHGTLDVYHIQEENVKDPEEYNTFSKAMKKVCTVPGSTVCVQHSGDYVRQYAEGHGFFAYLDKEGTFRLGHGYGDRGIVRHDNSVLHGDEEKSVADQTERLLKNTGHKVIYQIALNSPNIKDSDIEDAIENKDVLRHVLDSDESIKKYLKPSVFKRLMHSEKTKAGSKMEVLHRLNHLIGENFQIDRPETHDEKSLEYVDVLKDTTLHDKLVDLGQAHLVMHPLSNTKYMKNVLGIEAPKDLTTKVFDKFLSWNPKDHKKDYATDVESGSLIHDRELDMQHMLHRMPQTFTVEHAEKLFNSPNFGIHHGRIASSLLNLGFKSILAGGDSEETKQRWKNLVQKALKTESPHLHHYILRLSNNETLFDKNDLKPEHITHMLDSAHKHLDNIPRIPGDYDLGSLMGGELAKHMIIQRNLLDRSSGKIDDDHVSAIIKSNNHNAQIRFFSELFPTHLGIVHDTLSEKEVEKLANSPYAPLKGHALGMKNFPQHMVEKFITDEERPQLTTAILNNSARQHQIDTEHVEKAWDTHKKNLNLMYGENTRDVGDNLNAVYDTIFSHPKVSQRVTEEGLASNHPALVYSAMAAAPEKITDQHVTKILDTFLTGGNDDPLKNHHLYKLDLKKVLGTIAGGFHAHDTPSKVISSVTTPEHFTKMSEHFLKNFGKEDIHADILQTVFKNPKVPTDILDKTLDMLETHTFSHLYNEGINAINALGIKTAIKKNPNLSERAVARSLEKIRQQFESGVQTKTTDTGETQRVITDAFRQDEPVRRAYEELAPFSENKSITGKNLDEIISQVTEYQKLHDKHYTLNKDAERIMFNVLGHPSLQDHHIQSIIDSYDPEDSENKRRKMPKNFIEKITENKEGFARASGDTVFKLINAGTSSFMNKKNVDNLFKHPNLSSDHIDRLLKKNLVDKSGDYHYLPENAYRLLLNPNSTSDHISHVIDTLFKPGKEGYGYGGIGETKKAFIESLITYKPSVGGVNTTKEESDILRSKVTPEHIDKLYENGKEVSLGNIHSEIGFYPRLREDQKTRFIDDYEKANERHDLDDQRIVSNHNPNERILFGMLSNKNLENHHVDRIYDVIHPKIEGFIGARIEALNHPNLSPEKITRSLNTDTDPFTFVHAHMAAKAKGIHNDTELSDKLYDYVSRPDLSARQKYKVLHDIHLNHEDRPAIGVLSPYKTSAVEPRHYQAIINSTSSEDKSMEDLRAYHSETDHASTNKKMDSAQIKEIINMPGLNPKVRDSFLKDFTLGMLTSKLKLGDREPPETPPEDTTSYALRA